MRCPPKINKCTVTLRQLYARRDVTVHEMNSALSLKLHTSREYLHYYTGLSSKNKQTNVPLHYDRSMSVHETNSALSQNIPMSLGHLLLHWAGRCSELHG